MCIDVVRRIFHHDQREEGTFEDPKKINIKNYSTNYLKFKKITGFLEATKFSLQTHLVSKHSCCSSPQSDVLTQLLFALLTTLRQLFLTGWKRSTHLHIPSAHSENFSFWRHWSWFSHFFSRLTASAMHRPSLVSWKSFEHSHLSLMHTVLGRVHGHSLRFWRLGIDAYEKKEDMSTWWKIIYNEIFTYSRLAIDFSSLIYFRTTNRAWA